MLWLGSWLGGSVYYIHGTLKRLMGVLAWLMAWWIRFDHGYYIPETLKRLTDVVAWLKAWWIHEMSAQVVILAQFDNGYYIRGTLKWLADVFAWLKAWWIHILYPWDFEEVDGCFGLTHGLVDPHSKCMPQLPRQEEMPAKVVILAQFDHGYYIRGTLKRLTDVVDWLKARWIHFEHGYYIRGSLKWLTGVLAWLRALWILVGVKQVADQKSMPLLPRWRGNACKSHDLAQFDHGCYIRETLKWLTSVLAWPRDFWICTRNPCPCCLGGDEMPTKVMILAQFEHGYYIRGTLKWLTGVLAWLKALWIHFDHGYYIRETLKRLTDVVAWLKALWIHFDHEYYIRETLKWLADVFAMFKAWWIRTRNLCPRCLGGEEKPGKVMILAQFDHRYYIHGTLKRLMGVLAWLMAWWIRTRNPCHCCLAREEMSAKVVILAQFDHRYYIHGTLKWLTGALARLKAWWICILYPWDFEEVDGCFGLTHGLVDPHSKCMPLLPRQEEMPAKVVILAQFEHGYYIRETLKRLTDVVAWLKAWWICVSVKQVTDQKSMPLLPRWGGKVVILTQFGHGYYIHGTSKCLTGFMD
ncbi:hypothetical protein C8R44DRAFT_732056 [Mycena epipterygia]|nr:hypothetical protein C8R44DRAFT_732056 [Mycena epipterygia]